MKEEGKKTHHQLFHHLKYVVILLL